MQLVVIAGGLGTRLRPLTNHRPKSLLPLLNRPQILYLFDRLPPTVDHVLVAVNYQYEKVRDFFKRQDLGREVTVVHEPEPRGTAGAIKNVEGRIAGTFAAFNGDVVDSLDLGDLHRFHRAKARTATLALWPVRNPSAFGVVDLSGDRITRFVEKPKPGEAPSNLVNAGRYMFEPEIFDFIPANREVSLEREVFPEIVQKGLSGYRYDGYWSDTGTLATYLEAQALLLRRQATEISPDADSGRGAVRSPVLIAEGCFVEGLLGPDVVLGRGCRIGRAQIDRSTLFEGVSVDDKAEIHASILGAHVAIGEGARVRDSIIGDGAQVPPHADLKDARVSS